MESAIGLETSKVQGILATIKEGGASKLHIVADFDKTITYGSNGKEKVPSFIGILRHLNILNEAYSKEAQELYELYYPMEISTTLSREEKVRAMEEWWDKHCTLLVEHGLTKDHIREAIETNVLRMREGAKEMFQWLHDHKVPTIILSANGLGDESIKEFLEYSDVSLEYVHIVSNRFVWDAEGRATEVIKPHIHTLNKTEASLKLYPELTHMHDRTNVILLGDSIHDVDMVNGYSHDALLKVGFYNTEELDRLDIFGEVFDVLITGDGEMTPVLEMLRGIN